MKPQLYGTFGSLLIVLWGFRLRGSYFAEAGVLISISHDTLVDVKMTVPLLFGLMPFYFLLFDERFAAVSFIGNMTLPRRITQLLFL